MVLPCLSGVALLGVLLFAIAHFDVLTGTSKALSYGLCAVIPLALLTGVVLAARLRRIDPARFDQLGGHKI